MRCWLFGHKGPFDFYCESKCEQCGFHWDGGGYQDEEGYHFLDEDLPSQWGLNTRLKRRASRIAKWFCKCEFCGRRFSRHDYKVDHLPF